MFKSCCRPFSDSDSKTKSSAYIKPLIGMPLRVGLSFKLIFISVSRSLINILKSNGLKLHPYLRPTSDAKILDLPSIIFTANADVA